MKHIREKSIQRYVNKFVANLKKSVVRESVPSEVQPLLESEMRMEDDDCSPLGWNTWRVDVLAIDLLISMFHLTAIFLFTT
jgi:hypothetical protein